MLKINGCFFVKAFGFNFLDFTKTKLRMLYQLACLEVVGIAGFEIGAWGMDFQGEDRAVDVRIRSLRFALGCAGGQIKTMYRMGYKLEEES